MANFQRVVGNIKKPLFPFSTNTGIAVRSASFAAAKQKMFGCTAKKTSNIAGSINSH